MATTFYVDGASRVHRLNPVTKLVAVLVLVVVAFALTSTWWLPGVLLVTLVVPAALAARCGGRLASAGLKLLAPLLLALVVVQGLFFPEGRTVLAELGPARVTVEGLMFALGIALRIVLLVAAFLLLLLTTHPGALMAALTQHGMPPKISYVISSTLQVVPAFRDRAEAILLAQRARGMRTDGGLLRRVRVLLPLVTPLVLGLFTDVEERSTAMEARAFGATRARTALTTVPDSTAQRVARWVLAAAAVAAVAYSFLGGQR